MPHPLLVELSEGERTRALARYRILEPYLSGGVSLSRVAREQGLGLRTLQRWVQAYRRDGLAGLVKKKRSDRGQHRLPLILQHLVEGLALQKPPPSVAYIHRHVVDIATQQGWPVPNYLTVYRIVRELAPSLVMLAHQGTKIYKETFDVLYQRKAIQPNAIWQADHSLLEIILLNEQAGPAQPWLTVIMDDYSRVIVGYLLTFDNPCAINTALALHQAIWRKSDPRWHACGIPAQFYTDHGSDFTSHHMEQVSADLKIDLIFSIPGQPRGRGRIERFFRTIEQLLLCELPGYAPKNGIAVTTPTLTLPAFDDIFRNFILEQYNVKPHSQTGTPPQSLWEVDSFIPQMPASLEQLDLLLLTIAQSRRVRQDGVHFQGNCYFDLTLAAYVGEDVTIRYDPRDMAEIRVYYNNRFLCRAICQELAGETVSLKEIIRARNAQRRDLRQIIQDRQHLVDRYLNIHNSLPPTALPQAEEPTHPKLKRYANE
ncbi:MAG: transposase [Aggregatilineales bacterium]